MEFNKATLISSSSFILDDKPLSLLEQIAYIARVSNPENQQNYTTSEKLCRYLLKHSHFSPFEMVNIVIEIETTRDISRQIIRHRSFSFQEFSQRYAVSNDFVTRECRMQDTKNRQMSIDIQDTHSTLAEEFHKIQKEMIELEKKYYHFCLDNGIAKEQSRCILSEGLTKTKLYMNGTLRSWLHYLKIRCDPTTTQREHCDVAIKIANEIRTVFPLLDEFIY